MKLTVKDFLFDIFNQCIKNNISFKCIKSDELKDMSGYFSNENGGEICSVMDRSDWLEIMIHESCHMDQYLEGDKLYFNKYTYFDIFNGELLKYTDCDFILKSYKAWADLEIDADKRSLDKIKKYNLNIDIPKYIQKSNCYHQSYFYFHKYHIFYDIKNPPYIDDELIKNFNNDKILDLNEIWKENKELEKFLVKYNTSL